MGERGPMRPPEPGPFPWPLPGGGGRRPMPLPLPGGPVKRPPPRHDPFPPPQRPYTSPLMNMPMGLTPPSSEYGTFLAVKCLLLKATACIANYLASDFCYRTIVTGLLVLTAYLALRLVQALRKKEDGGNLTNFLITTCVTACSVCVIAVLSTSARMMSYFAVRTNAVKLVIQYSYFIVGFASTVGMVWCLKRQMSKQRNPTASLRRPTRSSGPEERKSLTVTVTPLPPPPPKPRRC